jgi:mRNA interferase MazF
LGELSKAQAEQVRSVSVARLIKQVGSVPRSRMAGLDDALRLHLAL